jgi:hypothetical protein
MEANYKKHFKATLKAARRALKLVARALKASL